jgi:ABC-type multidrug transport system ATPase subunit
MDGGKIITVETPRGAKERFPGRLFEVIAEPLKKAYELAQTVPGVASVQIFGDKIHAELTAQGDEAALKNALDESVRVTQFRAVKPTLEDVFIRLLTERRRAA